MKPKLSLVTSGTSGLPRAVAFYRDGLGWPLHEASNDNVAFFVVGERVLFGLFGREALAEDAGVDPQGQGFRGLTLAHNVGSPAEVDATLAEAVRAGATLVKAGEPVFWGGYRGYFADPDGLLWEVAHNPFMDLT